MIVPTATIALMMLGYVSSLRVVVRLRDSTRTIPLPSLLDYSQRSQQCCGLTLASTNDPVASELERKIVELERKLEKAEMERKLVELEVKAMRKLEKAEAKVRKFEKAEAKAMRKLVELEAKAERKIEKAEAERKLAEVESKQVKIEIQVSKEGEGKFLDLSGVPAALKKRSGLRKYLYRRDCYDEFVIDIITSLRNIKKSPTIAILGTAGIGKSSLFLVLLKMLLDDPSQFGLAKRSFYYQTVPGKITFYRHVHENDFTVTSVEGHQLDETFPLFADMETEHGSPKEHTGISLIFTSFRLSRYKELIKNGWEKILPTWSAEEQAVFFNSPQFESEHGKEVALRAYENIQFFGGSIRSNIQVAIGRESPEEMIERAITAKGDLLCKQFFQSGFGGSEEVLSDLLVHRNPKMVGGKYNFGSVLGVFSFASPYVLQSLIQRKNNMLVTEARNKYTAGTFSGGDNGNEFELLCLHAFKISNIKFIAQPLTNRTKAITVTFPEKKVLALNWREQENYLQADVLYIPHYGSLESGDAFCLININERRTLVILQCTIAETHSVKQNGIKIIHDCYTKKSHFTVDDTVIMFMIPSNGKLKTKQPLVNQKNEVVQQASIKVDAQYKIENTLDTAVIIEK